MLRCLAFIGAGPTVGLRTGSFEPHLEVVQVDERPRPGFWSMVTCMLQMSWCDQTAAG